MTREPAADDTQILLERHRAGDAAALGLLVQRYYPRVERIVRIRLGASLALRETVADVVQDVFVRLVEAAERYERHDGARFIDYVARLAQNEISNHARRERALKRGGAVKREVRLHAESAASWDVPADTTDVHSKAGRAEQLDIVDRCVAELGDAHREVILLREYAGASWSEVAERMGRPSVEACQELHRRARRALEEKLRGRL